MTYSILVEETGNDSFHAIALGLPECRAVATTRQKALAKLRELLAKRLATAEIVEVEIPQPTLQAEHSWNRFAGMFEDEPSFDEVLEEIETNRLEANADGNQV
jgi:predicted RNase H-like HicB family nuclease